MCPMHSVLKFTQTHKWFASVISRTPDEPTPRGVGRLVGIDLNLVVFSHDSDNIVVPHPHPFLEMENNVILCVFTIWVRVDELIDKNIY